MKIQRVSLLAIGAVFLASQSFSAIAGQRQERVSFRTGTSSATLSGKVAGDESIDYVLGAREGQTMTVTFKPSQASASYNVLPPGSETAIAIGTIAGNEWSGVLPATGDYRIRVFLVRAAARRNESASFSLTVGITTRAGDARVAGTTYHATGTVPCSVGPDAPGSAQCSFGVVRHGEGRADVHLADPGFDVKLHKDKLRVLRFSGNTVTSAVATEKVTAAKEGDLWLVSVNGFMHYRIPEAVIVGG